MPLFVRDLFNWVLPFPGNRSRLCIFTDKKTVGPGLDVRCLDGGALAGFPVRGRSPSPFPSPSSRPRARDALCPAAGAAGGARWFAVPSRRSLLTAVLRLRRGAAVN